MPQETVATVLSSAGVEQLRSNPSPDNRAVVAADVTAAVSEYDLSEAERDIALDILGNLADDVEVRVREALANQIKEYPFLPRSIARKLADDVESVALPVIKYSEVFTDEDLISIVCCGTERKQITVAARPDVREPVADSLVETGRKTVVNTLLSNDTAETSETALETILDEWGEDREVQALLVERPSLPAKVTERLVSFISDNLRERLIENHAVPRMQVAELAAYSQEGVLTRMADKARSWLDVVDLTQVLRAENKLSPTFLLRAICLGEVHIFESGIATLAQIPLENARQLIRDQNKEAFSRLYKKAGLPAQMFKGFRIALDFAIRPRNTQWNEQDTAEIIDAIVRNHRRLAPGSLDTVILQLAHQVDREPTEGSPLLPTYMRAKGTTVAKP